MAGGKMLTADVLALTTRVERQVAAKTPLVRVLVSVLTSRHRRSGPDRKLGHRTGASSHSSARLLTGRTWAHRNRRQGYDHPGYEGSFSRFESSSSGSESRPADSGGQRNSKGPICSIGFLNPRRLRG